MTRDEIVERLRDDYAATSDPESEDHIVAEALTLMLATLRQSPAPAAPPPEPNHQVPPPFWQHAIEECNSAHVMLDKLGAPVARRVRRVRGPDGDQDITIGLADRIAALRHRLAPAPDTGETP